MSAACDAACGPLVIEILIAVVAIGFARSSGMLQPGIDATGNPADAVNFMNSHRLAGNVLLTTPGAST